MVAAYLSVVCEGIEGERLPCASDTSVTVDAGGGIVGYFDADNNPQHTTFPPNNPIGVRFYELESGGDPLDTWSFG